MRYHKRMPTQALLDDPVNADYAATLARWMQFGALFAPAELRARVEQLEEELRADEQGQDSGRVIHLRNRHR